MKNKKTENIHTPVLKNEVIEWLNVRPNHNYIDATIGEGGHTEIILEKNRPKGRVLGLEWDRELYKKVKKKFQHQKRVLIVNKSYVFLKEVVEKEGFGTVSGVLFDLGMSTWHLKKSGRGFSFQKDEPLDMRFSVNDFFNNASTIINNYSKQNIKKILENYGEERFAQSIAQKIIEERQKTPIKRTGQLVNIIKQATPSWYHRQRIHPATRTFQALRIAVNAELENLKFALPQTAEVLEKGGRLVVISFHSLEEKIIKGFAWKNLHFKLLTKKPIRPSKKEVRENPRSRSAKLRAFQKL